MSRGLDSDDIVGDVIFRADAAVLLFLLMGGVVFLVLALSLPQYLDARCIAESGEGVVTKAEEVYRLEVYDGTEKKVVYVSRDDWERAGLDDIVSSAAPTRQGASDAAAPAEQQAVR